MNIHVPHWAKPVKEPPKDLNKPDPEAMRRALLHIRYHINFPDYIWRVADNCLKGIEMEYKT
jgi:hypothetical protein